MHIHLHVGIFVFWIVCLYVLNWIYPFISMFIRVRPSTLIKKCRTGPSSHRTDWNKVCHQDDFSWWLSLTRTSTEGLLITTPPCAVNVQVFSMFSLWNNFDVSCVSDSDIFKATWPCSAAERSLKRTYFVSCPFLCVCVCLPVCQCLFFLLRLFHPMPGKRHSITGSSPIPVQNNLGHTKWNKKEGSSETRLGPRCKV